MLACSLSILLGLLKVKKSVIAAGTMRTTQFAEEQQKGRGEGKMAVAELFLKIWLGMKKHREIENQDKVMIFETILEQMGSGKII